MKPRILPPRPLVLVALVLSGATFTNLTRAESIPSDAVTIDWLEAKGVDQPEMQFPSETPGIDTANSLRADLTPLARSVRALVLGGPTGAKILLVPNIPLLSSLLLEPGDLVAAQPRITILKPAVKIDRFDESVQKLN